MTPSPDSETVVACLTPPGQAAVATLALSGPRAWDALRPLFRLRSGAEPPAAPEPGRLLIGRLGEGDGAADDVVLAVKRMGAAPRLEVHCHGGREVVRYLLGLLAARGLRVCDWREYLHLTDDDPLRAAAAVALAEAPTLRTASILLDQYNGALGQALDAVTAALDRGDDPAALATLTDLVGRTLLGRRLTTPWQVAVAGAPNVGKSSLVNALAGYQRSITDPTPGTTRDVVTTRLAVDGWPVELADTAGLRTASEELEAEGVRKARAAAAAADVRLWVLDASAPPAQPDAEAGAVRLIVNKIDLPPAWDLSTAAHAVHVSAQTGAGMAELCTALGGWLVPDPPPSGAAVPFTERLCAGVVEAHCLLTAGRRGAAGRILGVLRSAASETA